MERSSKNVFGMLGIIFSIAGVISAIAFAVRIPFLLLPTIISGLFVVAGVILISWAFGG